MNNNWILDVLTDLKKFASLNGLSALEQELDSTHSVASAELDMMMERPILGSKLAPSGCGQQPNRARTRRGA